MKPKDDNDRLKAGTLPRDHEADAVPMAPEGMPPRLSDMMPDAVRRMLARQQGKEKAIPLPWETVADALGGGLWPGLHVLVGSTGAGKTAFCLQAALHAAQSGTPVLYIGLEAGDVEFVARCFGALDAGTFWSGLFYGKNAATPTIIETHRAKLEALPFHVLLAPPNGWDHETLAPSVAMMRKTYPEDRPILVVLDFLQIIGGREADRRERIGRAAYQCRGVAREYNAAVLVASSTSRTNYDTAEKKDGKAEKDIAPGKGNPARYVGGGKEAGEIEYAADSVLVLLQEPWPDGKRPLDGKTKYHLALAKVRAGQSAWRELSFDGRAFSEPQKGTFKA